MVVAVDRGAAPGFHRNRPERDGYVELDGEHVALQRQSNAAGSRGEAEEGDGTVDVELEPGLDGHRSAVCLGEYLLAQRPDIKLECRARLEGQADVGTETGLQTEVGVGSDAIRIEAEHGVDVELADAQQFHLGLGPELDDEGIGTEAELEATADFDRSAYPHFALEHHVEARIDGDAAENEEAGVRIGRQNIRLRTRVGRIALLVGLEAGNCLGGGIGVELEQELAADIDDSQQRPVGCARKLHPSHDPRTFAVEVGIELQVETAAERAKEFDLGAHGTGNTDETVEVDIRCRREGDEAGQRDHVEQDDAALDVGGDVELGRHIALAAVDLGSGSIDSDGGRRVIRQQVEEALRNLEHLLAQRRIH